MVKTHYNPVSTIIETNGVRASGSISPGSISPFVFSTFDTTNHQISVVAMNVTYAKKCSMNVFNDTSGNVVASVVLSRTPQHTHISEVRNIWPTFQIPRCPREHLPLSHYSQHHRLRRLQYSKIVWKGYFFVCYSQNCATLIGIF